MPTVDAFKSSRMTASTGDKFNPPGLTNFLGCLQAAPCVMGIQHLTFPPFSHGDTLIGLVTINDLNIHASNTPVTYQWYPDRIERSAAVGDIHLATTTVMGVRRQSVTIRLAITNNSSKSQELRLRIRTGAGVIRSTTGWKTPYSPKEGPAISVTPWEGAPPPETLVNNIRRETRDGLTYTSRTSTAVSHQITSPPPDTIDRSWLEFDLQLDASEQREIYFGIFVSDSASDSSTTISSWKADPGKSLVDAAADWQEEIDAVFTPNNDRYSGCLPTLVTSDNNLVRLYLNSIIGIVYHKRMHALSAYGRTYVTLMPRYWVTTSFINDWSFSAYLLAMLDPDCVRQQVLQWLSRDIYSHFGTEYVSGTNSGNWYSCNDYAMIRLIITYLRITGDVAFLDAPVCGKPVLEHIRSMAMHYKDLTTENGLADYGDRNSLLEAVGSYTHEVASINASNVWNLRELASLYDHLGDGESATSLRAEASEFAVEVLDLYCAGQGFFVCRQPDGTRIPVRHIWDFIHVINFLSDDMGDDQIDEMVAFFESELLRENWAAALSPLDEDVSFSLRLDHQWNGSWPGWVAFALRALAKIGRHHIVDGWIPGLARSANQGPFAQAHFTSDYAPGIDGGARKGPTEWPYINDWATVCVGGFFEYALLDVCGLEYGFEELLHEPSNVSPIPCDVLNIPWHGKLFNLHDGKLRQQKDRTG